MIKAVLFDVDGVLIDISIEKAQEQLQRDWGITPAQTEPFFSHEFLQCLSGKADLKEVITKFLKKWQWNGSVNAFLDYWFASQSDLNHDLLQEIEKLKAKGIRCYVATNQEKYRTEYLIHELHFGEIFDAVFSSSYMGMSKRSPQFFLKVLETIQLKPEEVLFWDDYPVYVDSARRVGINAEFYTNFELFLQKTNEYVK